MLAIYATDNPEKLSLYVSIKTLNLFYFWKKITLDFWLLKKKKLTLYIYNYPITL